MRLCGNAMARAEFKTGAEVMEFFSLGQNIVQWQREVFVIQNLWQQIIA